MAFFRDLARIKAKKRRMKNSMAVTTAPNDKLTTSDLKMLLFKQEEEDPLNDVEVHIDIDEDGQINVRRGDKTDESAHDDLYLAEYTREELYELGNGNNEEGVLLLSLYGRVYDVSEGWKYYGKLCLFSYIKSYIPFKLTFFNQFIDSLMDLSFSIMLSVGEGGKYHSFAGRDVTRALSTGCMASSCLGPKDSLSHGDLFDLNSKTIAEGKKWISFFETHDKYRLVGVLKDSDRSIDDLVDEQLDIQNEKTSTESAQNEEAIM